MEREGSGTTEQASRSGAAANEQPTSRGNESPPRPAGDPTVHVAMALVTLPSAHHTPDGDELENRLEPASADIQIAVTSLDGFEFVADWQNLLRRTEDAGSSVLQALTRGGAASWLTGATMLVVAAELVRLNRVRHANQESAPRQWPGVNGPGELA
jgi:hypothetical protein